MPHLIRVQYPSILQHEVFHSHPPNHLLPQTQDLRSSRDPNTNNTQGVSYHIPSKQRETRQHVNIHIIQMKYNLLKHNSCHSNTYRITSRLNTTSFTHFHIIHILKNQSTISLNQSIMINTQALCNKYTKTQSQIQCGTMLVKNLVGCSGVHDKIDHTLVSQVAVTR